MVNPSLAALASVVMVSLVSFVGAITLYLNKEKIDKLLVVLVSISAGTLFGGAFLHLIPEAIEINEGFDTSLSLLALAGILVFFTLDHLIHWGHTHSHTSSIHTTKDHRKGIAYLNLIGDGLHNFLDGLIIAGSYLISIPTGITATLAIVIHETPQEIADFGVLIYSGLSKGKALFYNFLSALTAVIGTILGLILGARSEVFIHAAIPFAAGAFVYIAGSNLIPELLHEGHEIRDLLKKVISLSAGIALMFGLMFLE